VSRRGVPVCLHVYARGCLLCPPLPSTTHHAEYLFSGNAVASAIYPAAAMLNHRFFRHTPNHFPPKRCVTPHQLYTVCSAVVCRQPLAAAGTGRYCSWRRSHNKLHRYTRHSRSTTAQATGGRPAHVRSPHVTAPPSTQLCPGPLRLHMLLPSLHVT
jgi:hypothetical protein